jgi:hypothetical protein
VLSELFSGPMRFMAVSPVKLSNNSRTKALSFLQRRDAMSEIKEHMKIIGKDGAPVGTVDKVDSGRIRLTKKDSPAGHQDHHHYIDRKLVGSVEGDVVKLSVNADAVPQTEEQTSKAGDSAPEGLRQATAKDEAKNESKMGHDLAKGPDRFEERSKSSDGKSAGAKQQG